MFGHAWVWSRGVLTDLGDPLGGGDSEAYAINDEGVIAGTARVAGTSNYDAVLWRRLGNGSYSVVDLGRNGWPYAFAQAINNAGDVAFSADDGGMLGSGNRRAWLMRAGMSGFMSMGNSLVPALSGDYGDSYGWGMNSIGTVVGSSLTSNLLWHVGWRYNGSYRENIHTLYSLTNDYPGIFVDGSGAYCINDYGDLGGEYVTQDMGEIGSFLLSGTNAHRLPDRLTASVNGSDYYESVSGINNLGDVLLGGWNGTMALYMSPNPSGPEMVAGGGPDYNSHVLLALNDLIPGSIGRFTTRLGGGDGYQSLSDSRAFAGVGMLTNGDYHGYLATPIPRPGNHAPVAASIQATNYSSTLVFPISALLAKATDADSDTLALLTTTQPASGAATVRRDGGNLIYQANNPTPPASDSFSCIIMDYHGGMATGAVQVVIFPSGPNPQLDRIVLLGSPGSSQLIRFHGTPGQTWRIQASDDFGSGSWTTIATVIAGPDGLIDANDAPGVGHSSRFYRAVTP
jgi:hypothetical protein